MTEPTDQTMRHRPHPHPADLQVMFGGGLLSAGVSDWAWGIPWASVVLGAVWIVLSMCCRRKTAK